MSFEFINIDIKEKVGILTINHPKVNTLSEKVSKELETAIDSFINDSEIRVIVITGAGSKFFVAGADIKEFQNKNAVQGRDFVRNLQLIFQKIALCPKPTICAINGYALGGMTRQSQAEKHERTKNSWWLLWNHDAGGGWVHHPKYLGGGGNAVSFTRGTRPDQGLDAGNPPTREWSGVAPWLC